MIVVYTRQPTDDQDAHDTRTHEMTDDDREWSGGSRRRRKKKRRRRRNVDEGHQQQKGTGSGAHQITALSLALAEVTTMEMVLEKWWREGAGDPWLSCLVSSALLLGWVSEWRRVSNDKSGGGDRVSEQQQQREEEELSSVIHSSTQHAASQRRRGEGKRMLIKK